MAYGLLVITILAVFGHTVLAADVDCKKLPPKVDPAICCPIPELITEENKEACKEYFIEPKPSFVPMGNEKPIGNANKASPTPVGHRSGDHHHHHHSIRSGPFMHLCFMNCALNDTGILANGKLNSGALSTQLKKVLSDTPDLIPVLEQSFKTCAAMGEKFHEKMKEKMKNRKISTTPATTTKDRMLRPLRCPPVASHMMACVFMETFMKCPASVWTKTKECNELRDHMQNCRPKYNMEDSSEEDM